MYTILTRYMYTAFLQKKREKMYTALLGLMNGAINNAANQMLNNQNYANTRYLMGLENRYAQQNAQIADERTRALYNDLQSPEAIRNQLENAGLSVGLMYGQGGMGGQMTQGAQPETPNAQNRGTIPMNPILDAQIEMYLANKEKTNAETEKTKTETREILERMPTYEQTIEESKKRIEQIDQTIEESKAKVDVLVEEKLKKISERGNVEEDTKLKEQQRALSKAQEDYQKSLEALLKIQIQFEPQRQKAQIAEIKAHAAELNASAKKIGVETDVLQQTKMDVIKKMAAEAALAEYQEKKLSKAEYDKIIAEVNRLDAETATKMRKGQFWTGQGTALQKFGGWLQVMIEDVMPF